MKKWEYMYVEWIEGFVARINSKKVDNFEYATTWSSVKGGTCSDDFIAKMGRKGWEAITFYGGYITGGMFFKRELENK